MMGGRIQTFRLLLGNPCNSKKSGFVLRTGFMKDFFVGLNTTATISGNNHSLSPAMMEMAENRISLPVVKKAVSCRSKSMPETLMRLRD